MKNQTYLSKRNIPLLYIGKPVSVPVLTLENYTKWYSIYLVMPDGTVDTINSDVILEIVSQYQSREYPCLWVDHLYHPLLLQKLAEKLNAELDERAQEVAAGRWYYESNQPLGNPYPSN